jgi:AAA domain
MQVDIDPAITDPSLDDETPLEIIAPTDRIIVEHPLFVLIGQPGIGKSSLGFSAPKPVVLNFDSESAHARAVNRGYSLNILTTGRLRRLEKHPEELDAFESIVFDTGGCAINLMALAVVEDNPKHGNSNGLTQQGWGALKRRFSRLLDSFRAREKNIFILVHSKEEKENDGRYMRADVAGGSRDEIVRLADFCGYLYVNEKNVRVLDFSPTGQWFGKNPAQWDPIPVPAPEKARTFLTKLFELGREALGKESQASADVAQQLEQWRSLFQTFTKASQFNDAKPAVKGLAQPVQEQAARALLDVATAKGIVFDKETKIFSDPPPPAPVVPVMPAAIVAAQPTLPGALAGSLF